ncbi:hypothetical protein QZH41_004690 [Actinostola sp. cb2023]|nr:hypothetical protein QZH41_004690 [Actinostola sp. cb2023]
MTYVHIPQVVLDDQTTTSRELKKVQEIINEERSFEIINLPQAASSTPSKHKPGHRKYSLVRNHVTPLFNSTPDSCASLLDESDLEFRSRVEKIRQLGGDKWLIMLGEIKGEDASYSQNSKGKSHPKVLRLQKPDANSSSDDRQESPSSENSKYNRETFVAKVAGVEPGETGTGVCRLHFGFTCELEELVRSKLDADNNTTSGTYMVEVETRSEAKTSNYDDHPVYEERMVGLDLTKGVILEIQIANGKTCAKHKLEDVSSVDILDIEGSYHIDIRDTYSKDWRRHKTITSQSTTGQQKDYRQVARYRMRSIADAAELFVLLYKFITKSWESRCVQRQPPSPSASKPTSASSVWTNPLRLPDDALENFFKDFLGATKEASNTADRSYHDGKDRVRNSGIHSTYHSLHADFIDAGTLNHNRVQEESVRMALWVGCLPYLFPEHELPVCLVLTDVNIFLFHIYHMSLRALKQVVIGLYDQGFRLEVRNDGPRGTFTFLTRDPEKNTSTVPSFLYPDELNLSRLKESLSTVLTDDSVKDEDLLMYSIVRELPEDSLSDVRKAGILTKRLRSLIVTNSKIFLCDEDHVHWPLPTFVRALPSTPQWVVSKWRELNKIIGIDVFDLENTNDFVGSYGLSLIFDDENSVSEEVESMASETHISVCWNLIFRSLDEREQLHRSLSQVWKDHFEADLKVTHSKPRSLPSPPEKDTSGYRGDLTTSPVGTPVESSFRKSHKRMGSDNLPLLKATSLDCLEFLMTLDRKALDGYFNKSIAQKPDNEEEKLLHVLWTGCTPYLFPTKEIQVCILLSNLFIYILADKTDELLISKKKSVKIRGRDKNSKGICYNFVTTLSLQQVCVGLFDQTFRLQGVSKDETFTLITRDFNLTNAFLECLNAVLSSNTSTLELDRQDSVTSIYDSHATDKTWPKSEFLHSESGVKYVYPSDDTLEILKDAIAKFSQGSDLCSSIYDVTILVYLLVFHEWDSGLEESRTLIIMDTALCLCIEDHANYPLTLFATGLPDNPQYQVWDVRDVETLSRIEFSDFSSCDFTLVFSPSAPECEKNREDFDSASMGELCVITHYTPEECLRKL